MSEDERWFNGVKNGLIVFYLVILGFCYFFYQQQRIYDTTVSWACLNIGMVAGFILDKLFKILFFVKYEEKEEESKN